MGPYVISIVFLIIFIILSEFNPIFFIFVLIFGAFISLWEATHRDELINIGSGFNIRSQQRFVRERSRRRALKNVRLYLAPHSSIWRSLKVSNKFCVMRLCGDGRTIKISEHSISGKPYKKLTITSSPVWNSYEMWDNLCLHFEYSTSYEGFKQMLDRFQISYKETVINGNINQDSSIELKYYGQNIKTETVEKLDINNASEVEITALPGISIVLSKKIIKKREEIGGFKTVEDVFLFLKLKPHMEKQLRNMICVKKMKGSLKIQRTTERSIDL